MLLSTAYLPPLSYFQRIARSNQVFIEAHEHFIKQTYRNRCHILGANGVQALIVPLVHTQKKTLISHKRIAYAQNWQHRHWKSIESAYRNAPYFIYYEGELRPFYERRYDLLPDYNTAILRTLLKLLQIECGISFTTDYAKAPPGDHRNAFSPKIPATSGFPAYTQVFADKHPFQPNLSIIDLLFNLGPASLEYLEKLQD